MAHHWLGDLATISSWSEVCLQEDLVDFISYKLVYRLLDDDAQHARFRLGRFVEIQIAETLISPGHSLRLTEFLTRHQVLPLLVL